jgi:hypothetical protein
MSLDLANKLIDAQKRVQVGAAYVHYRNPQKIYKVLNLALLEANEEVGVVYQAQYDAKLVWVRPLSSWLSTVEYNGAQVPRFNKVSK